MSVTYLDATQIKPDPNQPRQTWTSEDIAEIEKIVDSIRAHGVIEPVEIDENNQIILGERRWRACRLAGVKVPIRQKTGLKQSERFERQIIADSQRKELSPMDRAWAFATAIANINSGKDYTVKQIKTMGTNQILTLIFNPKGRGHDTSGQAELSRRTGISQGTIHVYLQNLGLEKEVQEAIDEQKIPVTVGSEIVRLKEPKLQKELQKTILKESAEKVPKRDEIRELVGFIENPEVEIKATQQKVVAELTEQDKEDLVTKRKTVDEIKDRTELKAVLQTTPEAQQKIREAIKESDEQVARLKQDPAVQERSRWYRNWLAHGSLLQASNGAFCPICGKSDTLGWVCHGLPLLDAYDKVTKEYQKRTV